MFDKDVPAVILSGGRSTRMDSNDKAFSYIIDQTLLEIVVNRLQKQSENWSPPFLCRAFATDFQGITECQQQP